MEFTLIWYFLQARIYAGGESENMIGRIFGGFENDGLVIASKAHPSEPGGLTKEGLQEQVAASLRALKVDHVDLLYLHQPDTECSLEESLEGVHLLMQQGVVGEYGLSNYSRVETERVVAICEDKGYALPAVFQGLYNALNRRVETELLPLLRQHGTRFVAFNPLAAGTQAIQENHMGRNVLPL